MIWKKMVVLKKDYSNVQLSTSYATLALQLLDQYTNEEQLIWGCSSSCTRPQRRLGWWPGFIRRQVFFQASLYHSPCCKHQVLRTSNRFPCSLAPWGEVWWDCFLHGVMAGACPEIRPEGWLRWLAHPSGGVECREHAQYSAFPLDTLVLH